MTDQNETQNNDQGATGGAPAPTTSAPVAAEIPQDVLKELETLRAHKAALEDDLKKNRDKKNAALEQQGRFEELAKARAQELEELKAHAQELQGLTSVKEAHEATMKSLKKMVKARLEALPEDDTVAKLIARVPDPLEQLSILDEHIAAMKKPAARSSEPGADGATPAAAAGAQIQSLHEVSGDALKTTMEEQGANLWEQAKALTGRKTLASKMFGN